MSDENTVSDDYVRGLLESLGDDTFAGIVRTAEVKVPLLRSMLTELLELRDFKEEQRQIGMDIDLIT